MGRRELLYVWKVVLAYSAHSVRFFFSELLEKSIDSMSGILASFPLEQSGDQLSHTVCSEKLVPVPPREPLRLLRALCLEGISKPALSLSNLPHVPAPCQGHNDDQDVAPRPEHFSPSA